MKKSVLIVLAGLVAVAGSACQSGSDVSNSSIKNTSEMEDDNEMELPVIDENYIDENYVEQEGSDVIYLAGGCFWGMEKLMASIDGVIRATSGYANGQAEDTPTYESVVTGTTGYRETVRVEYDPQTVSLDTILFVFFEAINPTVKNAQGNDIGTQYQTGIYYVDKASRETVALIAEIERRRYTDFSVEIAPLTRFYDAEDDHQDYLDKNPFGYCHISAAEFERAASIVVDAADYRRPPDGEIKQMLTELQYNVTQESATEAPFDNDYWDNHARGIYVDVVTGEPLFSSRDKFDSGTGWPSFQKSIDENTLVLLNDKSLGTVRTEVRSRAGNSHLGHVFYGEAESPSGVRYCINSAALRFIPYDQMDAAGYAYMMPYVEG